MIRLILFKNHISRTILIDNKEINILSPELQAPIVLKLDKIDKNRDKINGQLTEQELDDIKNLKDEKQVCDEILNDYLKEGWKLTCKNEW